MDLKVIKMVLDRTFYSTQMVDEKKFPEVLCDEADWVSFDFSAFLDDLWVFALTWPGRKRLWTLVVLRTLWHLQKYK